MGVPLAERDPEDTRLCFLASTPCISIINSDWKVSLCCQSVLALFERCPATMPSYVCVFLSVRMNVSVKKDGQATRNWIPRGNTPQAVWQKP